MQVHEGLPSSNSHKKLNARQNDTFHVQTYQIEK